MAFSGTPVVKQVSDRIVRITDVSLGAGANGTIGLFGATGTAPNIRLPESFKAAPYTYGDDVVELQDSLDVTAEPNEVTGDVQYAVVTKTGTTAADFRATINNPFGSATPLLEIYIKFHE
jgi:hypothetical protein